MKHPAFLIAGILALSLSACVGNGVEYGGVAAPVATPIETVPCEAADLRRVKEGRIFLHQEVLYFFFAAEDWGTDNRFAVVYDVTPEGQPVNVHFAGPPEYLRHTTRQKLIRAASDYVQGLLRSSP